MENTCIKFILKLFIHQDGIYKNLDHFLEAHICPDNIAVCVIIDGIDKMSKDMEKFFDEEVFKNFIHFLVKKGNQE